MKELSQLITQHHAVCIEGGGEKCRQDVFSAIEQAFGITEHGHPDLFHYNEPRLSIESVRRLRDEQHRRPVQASRTVFLIEAGSIPHESQNALLKSFEDPSVSTVFMLVLSHTDSLLPTLRSRLSVISFDTAGNTAGDLDATTFIQAPVGKRIELVQPLIEEKDRGAARQFLDSLERELAGGKRDSSGALLQQSTDALDAVMKCKQYVEDPGSSLKLLLEYVALRV